MKSMAELAMRMNESIDLADPTQVKRYLQGFQSVGEFMVGVRKRTRGENGTREMEMGPKGVVVPSREGFGLHVTYAGTPHHVPGMFGYWHINDVDEVYFTVPSTGSETEGTTIIMMRHPKPGERDLFAWYCQTCTALLYCQPFDSGQLNLGFPGLWQAEHDAVRAFNADTKLRQCKNCGIEHPLAYRFWAAHNNEQEEAQRTLW